MNIENLTPEQIQLILSSGEDDPAFQQADNRQKIADAMKQQAMGRIQGQQVGGVYNPGSALEGAAKIFQAYKGGQMQNEVDATRGAAQGRVVQGRQAYGNAMIEALRRKQAAGAQTPPMSMAGPGQDTEGYGVPSGGY